ncbi:MAG TPA: non-canonical purine NTP pyrophosphatase [Candidatus Binataceae bacterium]|nr:non-canonical purine NTP pyrophosphatase [Candidatus Binataceae bacterium]
MNRLLIATTNAAKLAEYRVLLRGFDLEVVSLREVGIDAEAPEDGVSFAANALIKARFYFDRAGIATLADDGGLEVDALGGAPGVHSHRWLGANADDRMLAEEIVRRMDGIEPARRTARLRAASALIFMNDGTRREIVIEATCEGIIAERCYPQIQPGFPYRAVLMIPERGRYLAELGEDEAARLSQRRIALEGLADDLRRIADS